MSLLRLCLKIYVALIAIATIILSIWADVLIIENGKIINYCNELKEDEIDNCFNNKFLPKLNYQNSFYWCSTMVLLMIIGLTLIVSNCYLIQFIK